MCKCKVCSDTKGYQQKVCKINRIKNDPETSWNPDYVIEVVDELAEYAACEYSGVFGTTYVFLYNGGEKFDCDDDYQFSSCKSFISRYFDYCPHCGRKLN